MLKFAKQRVARGILMVFVILGLGVWQTAHGDTSSTSATITATVTTPSSPVCGNGVRDAGEQCDDGNTTNNDGCSAVCVTEQTPVGGGDAELPIISGVVTSTTETSAQVNWTATDNFYVVSCSFAFGLSTNYTAQSQPTRANNDFQVMLSELTPETLYYYRISCRDDAFNTAVRTGVFTTLPADTEPPVISGVSAIATQTTADIQWQATDNTGISSCAFAYDADRPVDPYQYSGTVRTLVPGEYIAQISSLVPNTTYYYRISCSDFMPNTAVSLGQFDTARDVVPPADVSDFRANPRNGEVLLTWVYPNTISDVSSFVIRRSMSGFPATPTDGDPVVTLTNRSARQHLDRGLINDTEYFYSIFVFDTSQNHSNGVSDSAMPYVAGDRDGDGVTDDLDLCDVNNPNQIDTPPGTVVADNGCPRIVFDSTDLTVRVRSLVTLLRGRITATIPPVTLPTAVETVGLPAGVWYVDYVNYGVSFTVEPDGAVTWPSTWNNTFRVIRRDTDGTRLAIFGYRYIIDSSQVDPRGQFRIYNPFGSTPYLSDVDTVSLYPKIYSLVNTNIAPFQVRADGSVTWNSIYNSIFSLSGNTLRIQGVPVCVRQDTLQSTYRFLSQHGQTGYVSGDSELRILPAYYDYGVGVFSTANPRLQSTVRPLEVRNMNLFMNPVPRLSDPVDGESGDAINLTINFQNVEASLGDCRVLGRQCGNRVLELTEQCDDGNTRNNDGCSAFCTIEIISRCGNGVLNDTEECDDGNRIDGDSCSALCLREIPECGNNLVETGEQCDDGNTVSEDGCSSSCAREVLPVCGNAIIESGEQCDDGNLVSRDGCSSMCLVDEPPRGACADGLDNDQDGLIDLGDPGCTNPNDVSEYNILPEVPVEVSSPSYLFWIAERTIPATLNNETLTSLTGDQLTIEIPVQDMGTSTTRIDLALADNRYQFDRDDTGGYLSVNVAMPAPGSYDAYIEFYNSSTLTRASRFVVQSLPYGMVIDRANGALVAGVSVTLLTAGGEVWPGGAFRQNNPQAVEDGLYGYVVPNGTYTLRVEGEGFQAGELSLSVGNNVINGEITVVQQFESEILQTIDDFFGGAISDFAAFTERALLGAGRQISALARQVQAFASNPAVEAAAEKVVAPGVTGVAVIAMAPSVSQVALPLLRYLFLQPLVLLGQRKKREWGTVYNSLTKLPVDLAMVRLVDPETKRIIQSRVTDFNGRYILFADPGTYQIEVSKVGFVFPTAVLSGVHTDGRLVDLYHGEKVAVEEEDRPISVNIPLDPAGTDRTPRRIVWENRLRLVQHSVSITGIVTTLATFLIKPSTLTAVYLAIHVFLYVLFLGLFQPKKPKQWGTVYDASSREPVKRAIVRLFANEYNKLIATQITGSKGRYAFLVGPNTYRVSVEHPMYNQSQSEVFDRRTVDKGFINNDITVVKK